MAKIGDGDGVGEGKVIGIYRHINEPTERHSTKYFPAPFNGKKS